MTRTPWEVRYHRDVPKQIAKSGCCQQIFESIEELARAENPLLVPGVKATPYDFPGCHRQKVHKIRFVFQIQTGDEVEIELDDQQKGVLYIVRVGFRRDIYRR